jgi:L-arabinonolactonase
METGSASNRRVFAKLDTSTGGAADGPTVDEEGYLCNAQVFDGKIVRYAPDDTIVRKIEMPVKKVTSVMFSGPNLDILYVTSMAKAHQPQFRADPVERGALFAGHDLGVRGLPETRFGG